MFKLVVLFALVACAFAAPKPGAILAEPALAITHSVPVATSYSNSYQSIVKSPVVAATHVAYAAAPVAYKAYSAHPVAYTAHAAPLAYAAHAAPLAYAAHAAPLAYYH